MKIFELIGDLEKFPANKVLSKSVYIKTYTLFTQSSAVN